MYIFTFFLTPSFYKFATAVQKIKNLLLMSFYHKKKTNNKFFAH
ncbi:putative secreted protein [Candidatus Phytoplasma asteris]|uniref:Secreted protein n=1 Tax=Candidatus Phytoplasma asteris TaxID=85620 RepID=A0ABZ3CGQ2_9MOLU